MSTARGRRPRSLGIFDLLSRRSATKPFSLTNAKYLEAIFSFHSLANTTNRAQALARDSVDVAALLDGVQS